jgi:chromosome segregation ATPase
MMNLGRENADLKEELQRKTREFEILSSKSKEMRTLLEEKEIEVKRLEDLTAGLQREILHIKKEMNEKEGDSWNKEEIEEMKGLIKRLEQEVEGKNLEKAEILKKKEEEFREIKKANEMLMENNTKLQQNLLAFSKENATEKISLKEDVKKLEEHRENLKKELLRKDGKIIELEENLKNLQVKYVKTKEEVADIVNLVFEKGGLELMEEIEGYMVNLSEISKDLEAKLSEKR